MTRFLIHSNGPNVSTGYGVQTRYLVERLHAAGHKVAVSSTYGTQGSMGMWPVGDDTIRLYPRGYEQNSNDILHNHALHFFERDQLGGWIIPLLDVWCMISPYLKDFNVAAWTPVDHFPVPREVLGFFKRTDAVPIAMSRFGERLLFDAGLDPVYIPLSVDTKVFKPSPTYEHPTKGSQPCRALIGVAEDAFVVGMVAMNKGWSRDRKGFNEALRAFGVFWQAHQDAVLYLHCDASGFGTEGIDLRELAIHAGVPEHALVFVDSYAYIMGLRPEQMAAVYSAFDVLLAPSHGEGFCVPLIEAQACGTPVIASDFSSQTELVGAGWLVGGQPEWDPAQHATYICPDINQIVGRLEEAYNADRESMVPDALALAAHFDSDRVFHEYWVPFLASLEPAEPEPPAYDRAPMGEVAVIVAAMRSENCQRLIESFAATNDGTARLHMVWDDGYDLSDPDCQPSTYAEKVNRGFAETTEPWVLLVGDDVEFKPGWLEAARKLSADFDVIGTNDSSNGVKNPDVAAGRHADHFFVRRAYVDAEGACLDGPGVLAPEAYKHWFTDKEMIGLAKARGVFTPCLESVVEHHHPGYDGDERAREADPVYMLAVDHSEADAKTFRSRLPLIEMQRVSRAKTR